MGSSMFPSFTSGETVVCTPFSPEDDLRVGDVVIFFHPFNKTMKLIKRVQSIKGQNVFVVGDNPDILSSQDSHSFGPVQKKHILAIL